MEEKKDDILFAPPEFISHSPVQDPKINIKHHLNVLGIIRFLFGYVRNSSGQRDNMLMCVYISIAIFGAGIWWATHQEVRHAIQTPKISKNEIRKIKHKKNSKRHKKSSTKKRRSSKKNKTNIQINATAPPPLPSAYYYVLFGLVLLFVIAYYARRETGRNFILKVTQAATGHGVDNSGEDLKSTIMGYVNQTVSKITGSQTSSNTVTTTSEKTTETEDVVSDDKGRH